MFPRSRARGEGFGVSHRPMMHETKNTVIFFPALDKVVTKIGVHLRNTPDRALFPCTYIPTTFLGSSGGGSSSSSIVVVLLHLGECHVGSNEAPRVIKRRSNNTKIPIILFPSCRRERERESLGRPGVATT